MTENRRLLSTLNPSHTTPTNVKRRSLGRGLKPPQLDNTLIDLGHNSSDSEENIANETILNLNDFGSDTEIDLETNPEANLDDNLGVFEPPIEPIEQNPLPVVQDQIINMAYTTDDMIKSIPHFRGKREDLDEFLLLCDVIFNTLDVPTPDIFLSLVKSRIHGECRSTIAGLDTWADIKAELQARVLPVQSIANYTIVDKG